MCRFHAQTCFKQTVSSLQLLWHSILIKQKPNTSEQRKCNGHSVSVSAEQACPSLAAVNEEIGRKNGNKRDERITYISLEKVKDYHISVNYAEISWNISQSVSKTTFSISAAVEELHNFQYWRLLCSRSTLM